MKFLLLLLFLPIITTSFNIVPKTSLLHRPIISTSLYSDTTSKSSKFADELGIPCEEECGMDEYPGLPGT